MSEEKNQEGSLKQKSTITLKQKSTITLKQKSTITLKQKSTLTLPKQSDDNQRTVEEDDKPLEDFVDETSLSLSVGLLEVDFETETNLDEAEDEAEFLKDPGLNQAYTLEKVKPQEDKDDVAVYLRLVKKVKIMPIKRIISGLRGSAIHLQYYGLDCMQMKPLCEALASNTCVKDLNLKSNILTLDALYHLGLMLRSNVTLTALNLSQCKITAEGIELLGSGLEICPQLAVLDLSYNDFGDKGMEILGVKLCYNTSITKLNLSHNNLTHKTGIYLVEAMEENYSLCHVDLSWNQISEDQGLKKFLYAAAEHNDSILSLDLSWNNLSGEKIANIIKTFIGQHRTLQELNLSHNRFETAAEVTKIARGINATQNLKVLNLSFNGITADTAFALLSTINTKTKLKTLKLDNVWVKPEFEKLRREVERQTEMKIIIEGVSGGFGAQGPDMQTLLLKRAHHLGYLPKKAKNKKDFGWFLLRLQKTGNILPVKKAKFEKLVVEDKIKFDEGMVDEIAKRFKDENKKIDLNLMLEKYLILYPETALPLPKEKKKKKASKEIDKSPKGSPKPSKKSKTSSEKQEVDKKEEEPSAKEEEEQKEEEEEGPKENKEGIEQNKEDILEPEMEEQGRESITSKKEVTVVNEPQEELRDIEDVVVVDDKEEEPEKHTEQTDNEEQKVPDDITLDNGELEKPTEDENKSEATVVNTIVEEFQKEDEDHVKTDEVESELVKWTARTVNPKHL